jgi:predicted enzyme related to lactoylglutathione lyase
MLVLPCKFINYNLNRFSHEEIKLENGERDMPTIVHFEIPSDDIERSRKFYNELFGWDIEKWTGTMPATAEGMEYWIISTVDAKGNKALGGGMMKRQSPQQQEITNYFDVKSVQEYSAKVEKLGGKVISPKQSLPGMGYIAICTDTENNGFGIFEADQTAK